MAAFQSSAGPALVACRTDGVYALWLQYADGVEGRVDLFNLLQLGAFRELCNPQRFAEVRVRDRAVTWPCGVRLDPDVLYSDLTAQGCKPRARCQPAPMSAADVARIAEDRPYLRFRRALLKTALAAVAKGKARRAASAKRKRR